MTYTDLTITMLIVTLVVFAIWRTGQLNPVGTGKLARRMNALELKVAEQGARMDRIEGSILTIADKVGLVAENVEKVSNDVSATRLEMAGDRGASERTWAAVSRLENFFIQDSFNQRVRP